MGRKRRGGGGCRWKAKVGRNIDDEPEREMEDGRLGYGERKKDGSFMEDEGRDLKLGGCEIDCKTCKWRFKIGRRCKRERG